jgi:hypothetical protein
MENTYGLYIDNNCIDEVVIKSSDKELRHVDNVELYQKGLAEYFFRMRMGYGKIMEEKEFDIHLMTPNTDEEPDMDRFFNEGLCPACGSVDYSRSDNMDEKVGDDWTELFIYFQCTECWFEWTLEYQLKEV